LLAWAVLRERPNASQTLAVVLCALGLAVLIYPLAKGGVPLGLLLALAAGAMWGACEGQNFGAPKGALRTPELIRLMGNIKSLCVASSPCSVCIVARCLFLLARRRSCLGRGQIFRSPKGALRTPEFVPMYLRLTGSNSSL
jgi:hypothetical protein